MKDGCSTPASHDVPWLIRQRGSNRIAIVMARRWFDSRDAGARMLGVDRYEVDCEQVEVVKEGATDG